MEEHQHGQETPNEKAEFIPEDEVEQTQTDGPARRTRHSSCTILLVLLAILLIIAAFFGGYLVRRHISGSCEKDTAAKKIDEQNDEKLYSGALNDVSLSNLEQQLQYFSSIPHIGGSNESYGQAVYTDILFRSYGLKSELKRYNILLSYPTKPGRVALLDTNGTVVHESSLHEKILDPKEKDSRVVSPFNAYSPSGDVKGKLVYANYGHEDDFEYLEKQGVNVSGKIVIVRYGKLFRGGKAQNAEVRGGKGLIIYSDPADYAPEGLNKTYPDYEWLSKDGVQRGNLWMVKGDPLTPGYPATEGIYRVPQESLPFPKIPVQPISWSDAEPLLRILTKGDSPKTWRGGLDLQYNLEMDSADEREVNVQVSNKMELRPVYNVIGRITGSEEPDRYVIIGCHRDAWVFGAVDPSSGMAVMMEAARSLGDLFVKGWKPRRTILFASWGAEEYGIMGSGEWIEEYEKILGSRAVVYINVDSAVSGSFSLDVKSSPIMDIALFEATKKVPSAENQSVSLYESWKSKRPGDNQQPKVKVIGAGSDYLFFLQRIGVPCLDLAYAREKSGYPVYHSIHDSFRWIKKFADPDFRLHSTVTKVILQLTFDTADAKILPFDLNRLASSLVTYGKDLVEKNNKTLSAKGISLKYVTGAIRDFNLASYVFMVLVRGLEKEKTKPLELRIVNDRMIQVERAFINTEGLPGRPAMRHLIFAPSMFNLYAGSKFAGITDSIFLAEKHNRPEDWEQVKKQISMVVHALRSAVTILQPVIM